MALQGCWSEHSVAAACEDLMTHWRGPDALSLQYVRNDYAKNRMAVKEPCHRAGNDAPSSTGCGDLPSVLPDLSAMLGPIGYSVCSTNSGIPSSSSCRCEMDTALELFKLYGNQIEQNSMETKKHNCVWKVIQKEVLDWYESDTTSGRGQQGMVCNNSSKFRVL